MIELLFALVFPLAGAIPDEDVVLALRKARIAHELGDSVSEGKILDEAVAAHPDDPTCVAAALEYYRAKELDSDTTRTLRSRLLTVLSEPGRVVPYPLLADIAADAKCPTDMLARLADILKAQPGEAGERVARLRLRIEVLDRLGRHDERLAETERLATVDADPSILWNLLVEYRTAGKWEDVLRILERLRATSSGFEGGWIRLEALAGLGRLDQLEQEAAVLIDKMPREGPPGSGKELRIVQPMAIQGFFPTIFRLVDEGRVEAATKLAARLSEVSGGAEPIEKLRVMLFGSPEDRTAYLASAAATSLASSDVSKVRGDADQRLLAKDFETARGLYRKALELDPKDLERDVFFWFNYGLSCIETSSWTDAETAMSRAIALDPKMSRALAHRARARVMLKRIPEGIADAEAALAIDPKSKHACYAMYLAYHTLGDSAKAAEWLARFKSP